MTYVRYPNPRENSLRKKVEDHISEKAYYSWEITNILINLGMNIFYLRLNQKKVKIALRGKGFNSKELPEYKGKSKSGIVLYPEKQVWEYIKKCEKEGQIFPVEEGSLEKMVEKGYAHKLQR